MLLSLRGFDACLSISQSVPSFVMVAIKRSGPRSSADGPRPSADGRRSFVMALVLEKEVFSGWPEVYL